MAADTSYLDETGVSERATCAKARANSQTLPTLTCDCREAPPLKVGHTYRCNILVVIKNPH